MKVYWGQIKQLLSKEDLAAYRKDFPEPSTTTLLFSYYPDTPLSWVRYSNGRLTWDVELPRPLVINNEGDPFVEKMNIKFKQQWAKEIR
jgi:hypothetical protein